MPCASARCDSGDTAKPTTSAPDQTSERAARTGGTKGCPDTPGTPDFASNMDSSARLGYPIWSSMSYTIKEKKKLLARVGRIRGQVEALEPALATETACARIMHMIA